VPNESWLWYWQGWTWLVLACSVVITVWFSIGGFKDVVYLFRRLRASRDNPLDDGHVAEYGQGDER